MVVVMRKAPKRQTNARRMRCMSFSFEEKM
jgi:hypothetical protein